MLLLQAPGLVRAASEGAESAAGHTVLEALGVDWQTLAALARTTQRVDASWGRMRLEPLLGEGGELAAIVASDEVSDRPLTTPPPSSSRWATGVGALLGKDASTRAAVDLALRFARTTLPVLITAEEGSGADVVARAMHVAGTRSAGPFVHVRVGTVPSNALETILFSAPHAAEGGTLFVEDVHELEPEVGRRLAKEVDRGSLAEIHFVCSAPPRSRERSAQGTIAAELQTLTRGSTVVLPPLREREDLVHLAHRMLEDIGSEAILTPEAIGALQNHGWPGNLSELHACLAHGAVVAGRDNAVRADHLPRGIFLADARAQSESGGLLRSAERVALEEALLDSAGSVTVAARRLGVARGTLYRLMKRHGIAR